MLSTSSSSPGPAALPRSTSPSVSNVYTLATQKYLTIVSGKHRARLPEELNPTHSIECYDQLTKQVVPMHTNMIDYDDIPSLNIAEQPEGNTDIRTSLKAATPLSNCWSTAQPLPKLASLIPAMFASELQPEKKPTKIPIQPFTITHKSEGNMLKQSRPTKRFNESLSSGSKLSNDGPNGGSNGDLCTTVPITIKSSTASTERINTPALKSPLIAAHTMLNAENLASAVAAAGAVSLSNSIPQPFSLPTMYHPTPFTLTTPRNQLPFVNPSALIPLGLNSPLSALQQFSILSQAYPIQDMIVDCQTFAWSLSSKGAARSSYFNFMMPMGSTMLQTPPTSDIQEKPQSVKRCVPLPTDMHMDVSNLFTEFSAKKPGMADFMPSSNSLLSQVMMPLNNTYSPLITATTTQCVDVMTGRPDAHNNRTDDSVNQSGSNSKSKNNRDCDSENYVVTCLQKLAPIESTKNLPPCKYYFLYSDVSVFKIILYHC